MILLLLLSLCPPVLSAPVLPPATHLKVDRLPSKYALSTSLRPTFSWIIPILGSPGLGQEAYRILVTDEKSQQIVWDTKSVGSNSSINIPYAGPTLATFGSYSFTISWASSTASPFSPTSSPCYFGIGPSSKMDWQGAEWVGNNDVGILRATIQNIGTDDDPITQAKAYVAAPGCTSVFINGHSVVGNSAVNLDNGICKWEHYSKSRAYRTIDVLPHLLHLQDTTDNITVDLFLGHGMWTKYSKQPPTVLALIYLETKSGSTLYVPTTSSKTSSSFQWSHAATSYITSDDPFIGAEMNWTLKNNFVQGLPEPTPPSTNFLVYPMNVPAVVDQQTYVPLSATFLKEEYGGAVWVYKLSTNIVGTCEIFATGKGTIHVRHGETLLKNGSLNLNFTGQDTGVKANFQHDTHHIDYNGSTLLHGWRPTFTWYGFQYVSVHVQNTTSIRFNGASLNNSIRCHQMYPDLDASLRGSVAFTDDKHSNNVGTHLNKLHAMTVTSQLGNIVQYAPTDCPTREKHFWLGDALDTAEEAFYNIGPDVVNLYVNFLHIINDEQGVFDFDARLGFLKKEREMLQTRVKENEIWAKKFDEKIGPFEQKYVGLTDGISDIYDNAKAKHQIGIEVLKKEFNYHPLWKLNEDDFTSTPFRPE